MLKIVQIKPNPEGKDKYDGVSEVPMHQVASEWIEIKNESLTDHHLLDGIKIQKALEKNGLKEWWTIFEFPEGLNFKIEPEKIARIHSGKLIAEAAMEARDREGADLHFFTQKSYIWSNKEAEDIVLTDKDGHIIDEASYDPWPPEGEVLKRNDRNKLIYVFKEQS